MVYSAIIMIILVAVIYTKELVSCKAIMLWEIFTLNVHISITYYGKGMHNIRFGSMGVCKLDLLSPAVHRLSCMMMRPSKYRQLAVHCISSP